MMRDEADDCCDDDAGDVSGCHGDNRWLEMLTVSILTGCSFYPPHQVSSRGYWRSHNHALEAGIQCSDRTPLLSSGFRVLVASCLYSLMRIKYRIQINSIHILYLNTVIISMRILGLMRDPPLRLPLAILFPIKF